LYTILYDTVAYRSQYRIKQPTAARGTCPQTDWRFRQEIFAFLFLIRSLETDVHSAGFSSPDRGVPGLGPDAINNA
jgi:hypothetical protein